MLRGITNARKFDYLIDVNNNLNNIDINYQKS